MGNVYGDAWICTAPHTRRKEKGAPQGSAAHNLKIFLFEAHDLKAGSVWLG